MGGCRSTGWQVAAPVQACAKARRVVGVVHLLRSCWGHPYHIARRSRCLRWLPDHARRCAACRGGARCRRLPRHAGRAWCCTWCAHAGGTRATVLGGQGAGHQLRPGGAQPVEVVPRHAVENLTVLRCFRLLFAVPFLRVTAFLTATTEGTATPLISLGFFVRSLPSVF
jgi:hypothetical protein